MTNVVELAIACTVGRSPQIGNEYLCALQKLDSAAIEARLIPKRRKVFCEKIDQLASGLVSFFDQVNDREIPSRY